MAMCGHGAWRAFLTNNSSQQLCLICLLPGAGLISQTALPASSVCWTEEGDSFPEQPGAEAGPASTMATQGSMSTKTRHANPAADFVRPRCIVAFPLQLSRPLGLVWAVWAVWVHQLLSFREQE
uniref:Uncharacterized protein n=1 Tax=Molossus molossus TaxID=27622 RepID=A0A7J8I1P1_MOLMO|nr:hypothetical protein HJG59_010778 [Molossus molossus]